MANSTYFDFNAFEEVSSTGGLDPRHDNPRHQHRHEARHQCLARASAVFANDDLQQENLPSSLQTRGLTGNRVRQMAEYGGDVGGPLRKDRVWLWAAAAQNDIRQIAFTGFPDDSILNSISAKAGCAARARKSRFLHEARSGRFAGVTRPPETTLDQRGPSWIYKFEDAHVVTPSLFISENSHMWTSRSR